MSYKDMIDEESIRKYLQEIQNDVIEKLYKDRNGYVYVKKFYKDASVLAKNNILLKEKIGRGRFSKVKKGYKIGMGDTAIKIIDLYKRTINNNNKFMERELDIWSKLDHQHIIKMHDYIRTGFKVYIVLEYASDGDLFEYMANLSRPLSESKCKVWMSQLCSAVEYLHSKNIAHRDLKCENVLIDSNKNLKLTDFGLGKMVSSDLDDLCKTYCGTILYAPPEIVLQKPYCPKKADIWSLGVIFFTMINSYCPFNLNKEYKDIINQQKVFMLKWVKRRKSSRKVRKLLILMLKYEWKERASINQVLTNEWFRNNKIESDYNISYLFEIK